MQDNNLSTITLRMPKELREKVSAKAEKEFTNESSIVRKAVSEFLKKTEGQINGNK